MTNRGARSFLAKDLVANPLLLDLYPGTHVLVREQSWLMRFDTLVAALDLLDSGYRRGGRATPRHRHW